MPWELAVVGTIKDQLKHAILICSPQTPSRVLPLTFRFLQRLLCCLINLEPRGLRKRRLHREEEHCTRSLRPWARLGSPSSIPRTVSKSLNSLDLRFPNYETDSDCSSSCPILGSGGSILYFIWQQNAWATSSRGFSRSKRPLGSPLCFTHVSLLFKKFGLRKSSVFTNSLYMFEGSLCAKEHYLNVQDNGPSPHGLNLREC